MKIVLIQSPVWIIETPPYSLAVLKSLITSYGHECTCFDLNIELFDYYRNSEQGKNWAQHEKRALWHDEKYVYGFFQQSLPAVDKWLKRMVEIKPMIIGFTVQLTSLYFSIYLAEILKKALPQVTIIFGGPAAHRNCKGYEIISRFSWIDAVCWGESEGCLSEMLSIIETKGKVDYCKGFAIRGHNGEALDCLDTRTIIEDLDTLPFADFSDFPIEKYTERKLPISISRGCIYRCIFCNERLQWKRYRFRSAENIYNEIEHQLKTHPRIIKFFFNDSLVNGNIKILKNLSELIIKNCCGITWSGQATVREEMTRGLLDRLKLSGCDTLIYGIESGSNKILKLMGKPFTSEIAERCLENTYEAQINANFNIIVGFPQEGEAEFQETVEFLKKNIKYAKFVALTMFYCNKDTELSDKKEFFNIGMPDGNHGHVFWYTKDKKNTYEERLHKLKVFKDLCEDKSLWDQDRVLNMDIKGEKLNPIDFSPQPIEAITVQVYDKEKSYLLSDEDNKILGLVREYMSKGRFDEAISELKKILNKSPDEPRSLCLLGEIYVSKYDYDMANRVLKRIIMLYPGFSWVAYRAMGNLYLKMNNEEKALRNFDKAVNLANDNRERSYVYYDMANFFISEDKKRAINYLKKAIELQPGNELYNNALKEFVSEDIK